MKTILAIVFVSFGISKGASEEQRPVWGLAKEGISIGVRHDTEHFEGNGAIIICVAPTNYLQNLVRPESEQLIDIRLKDKTSKAVALSEKGKTYGAKVQTTMARNRRISRQLRLWTDEPQQLTVFRIDDFFKLTEGGEYELDVRVRLLKESGKELLPVFYDTVELKLHLTPNSVGETKAPEQNRGATNRTDTRS